MEKRESRRSRRSGFKGDSRLEERINCIIQTLDKQYENPCLELEFNNAFELFVEAILAAQASDRKVNEIAKDLFKKYKTPQDIASATLEGIEKNIKSINFYRRKALLLKGACVDLIEKFGGNIPKEVDKFIKVKGVGRKTANMVLGGAYRMPAIIVDRHVQRVTKRIGLTKEKEPDNMEKDLMQKISQEKWLLFSLLMLNHGKMICRALKPKCQECLISHACDYFLVAP